jgi:hypothetical protein
MYITYYFVFTNVKRNRVGRFELESSGSGLGQVAGSCGQNNKPSGSIKGEIFLTNQPSDYQLVKTELICYPPFF